MKKNSAVMLFVAFITLMQATYAQNYKFGKVSKEELEEKYYPSDSSANAAVLYKKRKSYFTYDQQNGWLLKTVIQERLKLYTKEGFDWATKKIKLYHDGDDERVAIKAYTYNLNNGKIEKTKLKNDGIFKEDINKYWEQKKFTLPNLKEGSVIEWEYTISSPYFWKIDDVVFQYEIPVKKMESKIEIPEYFIFKNHSKGFYPINYKKSRKSDKITFNNKTRSGYEVTKTTFSTSTLDYMTNVTECTTKNVPAIKKEAYVNNLDNYKTILKYELSYTKFPNSTIKYYNTTWEDVTKTIYKSSNFGEQLNKSSYFKEELSNTVNLSASVPEKIGKIFEFVKSKIKWNGYNAIYAKKGVKKAYKEGMGNVAEINLALVAMLREAGLNANPILVSTRSNGIPLFPTTDGFNYVIVGIELQNNIILLDAADPYSTPNILPLKALNWQGRLVRKDGSSSSVNLFPKKYAKKNAIINASVSHEGSISGLERVTYSNLNALNYRTNYMNSSEDDLISRIEKNNNIEVLDLKVTNKTSLSKPIMEVLEFETEDLTDAIGDKIYINPLLFLTKTQNPFKLDKREYPVDFGSPWEDKCTIVIELPKGYTVESLPEKAAIGLPEKLGSFTFLISHNENKINILASTKINIPIVAPQYYLALKEFYKKMIEKQSEKIVLKRI